MILDELRAKFEATFPHLDFSADKYGNYYSQRTLDHLYGYQAAHASRDSEVEALKRDAKRYRKLLALLDAAEQVSNEASTIRNIIEDSIGLGSECLNLHLDAMTKESQK